eukprot:373229-Pelagomonas_calceolata.AAC.6
MSANWAPTLRHALHRLQLSKQGILPNKACLLRHVLHLLQLTKQGIYAQACASPFAAQQTKQHGCLRRTGQRGHPPLSDLGVKVALGEGLGEGEGALLVPLACDEQSLPSGFGEEGMIFCRDL